MSEKVRITGKPRLIIGATLLVLSVGMVFFAIKILNGDASYFHVCNRSSIRCIFWNELHELGGDLATGMIGLGLGLFVFVCSFVLLIDDGKSK